MLPLKVGTEVLSATSKIGKHKVPRFIYHLTTKKNYESILKDGYIKPSSDAFLGKGVFSAELTNLFKRWQNHKAWGFVSLQDQLIKQVAKGQDEIVILKIPTAKLNPDLLKIRSQHTLFNFYSSDSFRKFSQEGLELMERQPKFREISRLSDFPEEGFSKFKALYKDFLTKLFDKIGQKDVGEMLVEGIPAKYSKLLKQRKKAIEYVYFNEIPSSNFEKIGEVNISKLRKTADYDPVRPMRSIFSKLLQGTPEEKGALLLNC